MTMPVLTPAEFKQAKPQFSSVVDNTVQAYIDMGRLFIDESYPANAIKHVWIAITCHLMTLDGLGTDSESQSFLSGNAAYQTIKSGEITLTKYQKASETMSYDGWLSQTKCGQFYYQFLRMYKGGARIAMGGIGAGCCSGYAKDWPLFLRGI